MRSTSALPNRFLSKRLILAIHRDLIASYGGDPGLRDEGLLESALAQPEATFQEQLLHPTVFDQAAAYLFHLVQNHPFVDGNKRIALAAADIFLRINGWKVQLSDEATYELVIDAASGAVTKEQISLVLEANSER